MLAAPPPREKPLTCFQIVCPELDNVIANLELMPLRRNESKKDKVESRQLQTAEQLYRAGWQWLAEGAVI